ncbi:MAG TPA: DinB family protein [Pyrinomonadaceae bacterium]|nr:DinB family protein [Pyrinomonadaceae bacterium]
MDSDWLKQLPQTINEASGRLLQISEEASRVPVAEGKWSPKQIVGHLIDSAANNHQRFVRAQFSDDLVFPGYEQEAWVEVQRYNDEPWHDLIQLWRQYNLHLCHVMSSIPDEVRMKSRSRHNLDRIAWQLVDADNPVTLEYFMRDYAGHLQHHLNQIFK